MRLVHICHSHRRCSHPCDTSFDTLLPRLMRRARKLTSSPEDAADLAQDAALRLWLHLQDGAVIANPEAYAMRILSNLAHSAWRAHRPVEPLEEDTLPVLPDAPGRIACA